MNDDRPPKRWKSRPPGSNWGDFGPDDQIGRLNLLTPERRVAAVREVHEGIVFCLSLPLDLPGGTALNPRRLPPVRHCCEREPGWHNVNYPFSRIDNRYTDSACDDFVTLYTQYSTQWDALSHIGQRFDADGDGVAEIVYYNGYRAGDHIIGYTAEEGPKAAALGIEHAAKTGVQGRGVLIDLQRHFGCSRRHVGYDDLMLVIAKDKVEVETGDIVCLHTGFAQRVVEMAGSPDATELQSSYAVLDGRDARLLQWIDDSGLAALVADNFAVEAMPNDIDEDNQYAALPLHEHCLFKLGIHLGELWWLTPLSLWLHEHQRHRFLLTAPPLRLPGSFGSPVTPVATV